MSRKALEDIKYETIKAHMLDPEHSPLPADQAELLDRIVSLSKILDKNPLQKQAIALHRIKYPNIVTSVAYEDMRLCLKLFNTLHTFNFEFWQTWLINDIIGNIIECRKGNTDKDRRVISMEHTNLLKAIGEKPENLEDPKRTEKHQFYILIQNNNQQKAKSKQKPIRLQNVRFSHFKRTSFPLSRIWIAAFRANSFVHQTIFIATRLSSELTP